jgi:glycosyltransferase involved in cell wall biosynthesis
VRVAFVISDLTYPPVEGIHQQTVELLKELRATGCDILLFSYCRSPEKLDVSRLEVECGLKFALPAVVNSLPLSIRGLKNIILGGFFRGRDDKAILRAIGRQNCDVIHLEGAAACGLFERKHAGRTVLGIIDPGSRRQLRLAQSGGRWSRRFVHFGMSKMYFLFESLLNYQDAVWHVVSDSDRDYLIKRFGHKNTVSIPVMLPAAIDPAVPSCADEVEPTTGSIKSIGSVRKGVVFADFRFAHMRSAFLDLVENVIRPALSDGCPVELEVLGRSGVDGKILDVCRELNIEFRAWVDDYITYLRAFDFVIIPDKVGTGLKNRTIQCMALGLPVLGTEVAFEGIPAVNGFHAIVARDGAEMICGLNDIVRSSEFRHGMSVRAREFALSRYGCAAVASAWRKLYLSRYV